MIQSWDLPCNVRFGTLSIGLASFRVAGSSHCFAIQRRLAAFQDIRRDCLALRHVALRALDLRSKILNTGTVKWFNAAKGFGFIQPENGGADAFVHISAVERAGLDNLNEGDRVEYELVRGQNGKSSAENLKLAS